MPRLRLDPFSAEFRADPYPTYDRLRDEAPVHRSPFGSWLVSEYDDVATLLHDRRAVSTGAWRPPEGFGSFESDGPLSRMQDAWVLFRDPPDHTFMRKLMNAGFKPRRIEEMRSEIQSLVDRLLEEPLETGRLDAVADFAHPIAVDVICGLLGVPPEDREPCRQLAVPVFQTMLTPLPDTEALWGARTALARFESYFEDLIDDRRRRPRDDMLSALTAVEEGDERLSVHDVIANTLLLFGAGHDTAIGLIGMGIMALHRHPEQLAAVRANGLSASGVNELARFDSPIQMATRIAAEDIEIGGVEIERGEHVTAVIGSANRDPKRFSEPGRLDLGRDEARPLAFGLGVHYCVGAPLARLEVEIAIATLFMRTRASAHDDDGLKWRTSVQFRGLDSLPLELEAA